MAYETQVTVFLFAGGSLAVTGTLWDCWLQSTGSPHEHEDLWETQAVGGGTNGRITFVNGPGVLVNGHAIALSLEDPTMPGKIFRSGANYNGLPPGASAPGGPVPQSGLIEALCGNLVSMSPAAVSAALPAVPFSPSADTTITAIPIPLFAANNITITVTGTTTHGLTAPVGFTYTININFAPSTSEFHPGTVIDVLRGASSITFGSPSVAGSIEAFVLNLVSGWIDSAVTPSVIAGISTAVNASVLANAAATVGKAGGTSSTTLPPGVVLSLRNIMVTPSGIGALPALGAYGGLFNKLFPSGGGTGGGTCLLSTLALLYGASLQLENFRHFRDTNLVRSVYGRWFERMYYRYSSELNALLASEIEMRALVISVCERIDEALRTNRLRCLGLSEDIRVLADEIAVKGTPSLRSTARLLKQFATPEQLEAAVLTFVK